MMMVSLRNAFKTYISWSVSRLSSTGAQPGGWDDRRIGKSENRKIGKSETNVGELERAQVNKGGAHHREGKIGESENQ